MYVNSEARRKEKGRELGGCLHLLDSDVRDALGPGGVNDESSGALGDDASALDASDALDVGNEGAVLAQGLIGEGEEAAAA